MNLLSGFILKSAIGIQSRSVFVKSFSTIPILCSKQSNLKKKNYGKDVVIRNIDEQQESPLVVIVGWSNSKIKQIAKYSEIFEQQGCTTISVACSIYRFVMFYDSLFANDTKLCLDAMSSQRNFNPNRKVFFQLFSTPGPAMYINIMNYYYQYIQDHFGTKKFMKAEDEALPNICGVIYDSPTVQCGDATQFANGMKGNTQNAVSNYFLNIVGKMVYAYAVRQSKMFVYGPEFLKQLPVLIPQLMLYSKVDAIADYKSINSFIAYQKSIGTVIKARMWEDSKHVLHYRKYPEEYKYLVNLFLRECVTMSNNAPVDYEVKSSVLNLTESLFADKKNRI